MKPKFSIFDPYFFILVIIAVLFGQYTCNKEKIERHMETKKIDVSGLFFTLPERQSAPIDSSYLVPAFASLYSTVDTVYDTVTEKIYYRSALDTPAIVAAFLKKYEYRDTIVIDNITVVICDTVANNAILGRSVALSGYVQHSAPEAAKPKPYISLGTGLGYSFQNDKVTPPPVVVELTTNRGHNIAAVYNGFKGQFDIYFTTPIKLKK